MRYVNDVIDTIVMVVAVIRCGNVDNCHTLNATDTLISTTARRILMIPERAYQGSALRTLITLIERHQATMVRKVP